jgi:hypothetical protein
MSIPTDNERFTDLVNARLIAWDDDVGVVCSTCDKELGWVDTIGDAVDAFTEHTCNPTDILAAIEEKRRRAQRFLDALPELHGWG